MPCGPRAGDPSQSALLPRALLLKKKSESCWFFALKWGAGPERALIGGWKIHRGLWSFSKVCRFLIYFLSLPRMQTGFQVPYLYIYFENGLYFWKVLCNLLSLLHHNSCSQLNLAVKKLEWLYKYQSADQNLWDVFFPTSSSVLESKMSSTEVVAASERDSCTGSCEAFIVGQAGESWPPPPPSPGPAQEFFGSFLDHHFFGSSVRRRGEDKLPFLEEDAAHQYSTVQYVAMCALLLLYEETGGRQNSQPDARAWLSKRPLLVEWILRSVRRNHSYASPPDIRKLRYFWCFRY
jgi:hypothetical protein